MFKFGTVKELKEVSKYNIKPITVIKTVMGFFNCLKNKGHIKA